jgi:hypothetical protein
VSIYFLLSFVVKLLFFMLSENLSQKLGFKGMIRLSSIPFFLFVISLLIIPYFKFALLFSAIFWGAEIAMFWWGYHGYFVKSGDSSHFGESIGEVGLLETVVAILTPILGAGLIVLYGFNSLFITAFFFMALALFLIGRNHDKKQQRDILVGDVINLVKKHKFKSLAYAGTAGEGVIYAIFWPIFLHIVMGGYLSLGSIVSVSGLIAALLAVAVGRWTDTKGTKNVLSVGTPIVTSSWIIRFLSRTPVFFVVADTMWRFGQSMVGLPLNVLTYKKALDGNGVARAILFREIALSFGGIVAVSMSAVLFLADMRLEYVFLLAVIFSIFPLLSTLKGELDYKND